MFSNSKKMFIEVLIYSNIFKKETLLKKEGKLSNR